MPVLAISCNEPIRASETPCATGEHTKAYINRKKTTKLTDTGFEQCAQQALYFAQRMCKGLALAKTMKHNLCDQHHAVDSL